MNKTYLRDRNHCVWSLNRLPILNFKKINRNFEKSPLQITSNLFTVNYINVKDQNKATS